MTAFLFFTFLVGAVLGQRFRVLVLLPLTLALVLIAIPVGVMAKLTFFDCVQDIVLCALALQFGYLFGSAGRFLLGAARSARVLPRPFKAAR